jgi:hypothetical protein
MCELTSGVIKSDKRHSLWVPDVCDRAIEGDPIADVDVEPILPVGLVYPVSVGQRKRLPLLAVTYTHRENRQECNDAV